MRLLLHDGRWHLYKPLTWLRPLWELRLGAKTLAQRASEAFGLDWVGFAEREWLPWGEKEVEGDFLVLRPDVLWRGKLPVPEPGFALVARGESVGFRAEVRGKPPLPEDFVPKGEVEVDAVPLRGPWDLIAHLEEALREDLRAYPSEVKGEVYPGAHLVGRVFVAEGSKVYPGAVLVGEEGPVVVERGSVVLPGAILVGPLYLGPGSKVKPGAKLSVLATGPVVKLGGEVEETIIQGYSNKQHEGFLGHAYLGEWVNIGAGTEVSDLKNTYGPVKMWQDGGLVDTGLQFLGPVIGDHSKTGINTTITTGAVIGVFANLVGAGIVPKFVPSFSWGYPEFSEYRLEKALEVARRVMARRGVELGPEYEGLLRKVFELTRTERA